MSYANISDAVTEMCDKFRLAWVDDEHDIPLPADYPGTEFDVKELTNRNMWARWRCNHGFAGQGSLAGGNGARRWDRSGTITVQVFTPQNAGVTGAYQAAEKVVNAYQGQRTPGDAWFRDVRINEVSGEANSGLWYQLNVLIDFEYEQFS